MASGYDLECEKHILAAMLQRKEWLLDAIAELKASDFTTERCRRVFNLICQRYVDQEPVNVSALFVNHAEELKANAFSVADAQYLVLKDEVPAMIRRMKEQTKLRELLSISDIIRGKVNSGDGAEEIYADLENMIASRDSAGLERTYIGPQDMAMAILDSISERMDPEKRSKLVLYTQYKKLNYASGGFEKGDLVILSAQSGGGKSAFAMNVAYCIGVTQKKPVLYLNSEMSTRQMADRWGSFIAKLSHSKIRNGDITDDDYRHVMHAAEVFNTGQLYTINIPDLQIANVLAEIRRARIRSGIELAIIDYIGRMDTISSKDVKEWQIMKNAARQLKTLAQELDITIIMVAQLSEDGGRLAQGSYMKHEADLWLDIKRIPEGDEQSKYPWNCYIEFRKARNAENGKQIPMNFFGDCLTFTDDKTEAQKYWKIEYALQNYIPTAPVKGNPYNR